MQGILLQISIYLAAAVVMVPLSRRLGLGSVLGYLIAGIIIGPVLGFVGRETESVMAFAEYGVVIMLFLIGLEMQPKLLWDMRHRLVGMGGLQVVVTTLALAGLCVAAGLLPWTGAVAAGMVLSLSSTAIVMQTLTEKRLVRTDGGRASLAVLLFQDVAALPMLALMPLLAAGAAAAPEGMHGAHALEGLPPWARAAVVVGAIGSVVLGGRYLSGPLFRFLATARLPEIQIAGAILLIAAVSLLMSQIGLSPALGSFLAGVVLASSEYRHQLEADLEPFRGLLMGLFFLIVGAGIDLHRLAEAPGPVIELTIVLVLVKMAVLWPIARLFRLQPSARALFTLSLAQGGEFGFVILAFARASGALGEAAGEVLLLIIALSMMLTPALFWLQGAVDRWLAARGGRELEPVDELGTIIVAGMGRFGQLVNRILTGVGHRTVVLDSRPEVVARLRRSGVRGFYGDVERPELLAAAGIARAKAVVIAIDEPAQAVRMVRNIRRRYPDLPVIVRARDRHHAYGLMAAGATETVREILGAAVEVGRHTLSALGHDAAEIDRVLGAFVQEDQQMVEELAALWRPDIPAEENAAYLARERQQAAQIEAVLRGVASPPDRSSASRATLPEEAADVP